MYTRWRLYILAVLLLLLAACLLFVHFLRKHGVKFSNFQAFLFTLGILLCAETVIVSTLSNYNLGVILPAFFGAPMIAISFLLPHMNHGILKGLKILAVICYSLAAVIFIVCGICMVRANRKSGSDVDAVIVLGAAVHGDKVTWVLENRLNTTIEYMEQHPKCVCVVSGGMGSGESVTEGSAMRKYLIEHGVAPEKIYSEENAANTTENFRFSLPIIQDSVGTNAKIGFVTTDFHVFRAGKVAEALGIHAVGIPAPDVWYLRLNNFMRECVGICVYALTGKI